MSENNTNASSTTPRSDFERALVAITAVADLFNRGLSDASLRLYAEALAPWPVQAIEGCVPRMLRDVRFFPAPAEWAAYAQAWHTAQIQHQRAARLRTHALTQDADAVAEDRAQAATDMIGALKAQLGWRPRAGLAPTA